MQKCEKTSDEAIKADATYTNFDSRNLSSTETHKHKTAICFHRHGKPELHDLLHEWQKSLLWVGAKLCCSHYALCMCGLLGIFSSLRWTVRWWVQTCFLMGDASLLVAGRKTLDMWSGRHMVAASQAAGTSYTNTVNIGVPRLSFKTLEAKFVFCCLLYIILYCYLTLNQPSLKISNIYIFFLQIRHICMHPIWFCEVIFFGAFLHYDMKTGK